MKRMNAKKAFVLAKQLAKKGISRQEIAKAVGYSYSTIYWWLKVDTYAEACRETTKRIARYVYSTSEHQEGQALETPQELLQSALVEIKGLRADIKQLKEESWI